MKPRLLDLFCGAGGAAMGYHRAGFEVVGVDIKPQPRYPFEFVQYDALQYVADWHPETPLAEEFDAIHASPPCQAYSKAWKIRQGEHPDLIGPTRELLEATGLPYAIENVKGAPLRDPVLLEGQMFPELRTHRPRLFETNWPLDVPLLRLSPPRQAKMGRQPKGDEWIQVVGHAEPAHKAREAMGIDWMTRDELSEAIPPAYTEFIGTQLLAYLERSTHAA
ncbi:MAG TPA: DNA cytosine methyltransferase [Gemmatimonadales bacterium]|nr:DNA cytosine methyltransferase [Gemmatimonadales bacterium]